MTTNSSLNIVPRQLSYERLAEWENELTVVGLAYQHKIVNLSKKIVTEYADIINQVIEPINGDTISHIVARRGNLVILKALKIANANMEQKNNSDYTPHDIYIKAKEREAARTIEFAIEQSNELKKELESDFVKTSKPIPAPSAPRTQASSTSSSTRASSVPARDTGEKAEFFDFIRKNDCSAVQIFLKTDFKLLYQFDYRGLNPLHNACLYGHLEMCQLLIQNYHADVNAYSRNKKATCGHLAMMSNNQQTSAKILSLLLDNGMDLDAKCYFDPKDVLSGNIFKNPDNQIF